MRRVLSIVSVVVVAGGLIGACSSSGSSGKSSGPAANTVALHATDFAYSPTAIDAKAGKVTFTVDNTGAVEHNLTIPDLDVEKDVEEGETISVTADAKAGTYAFHCEYHPTKMKGTITIGS
jgi:plastocyanin